MPESTLELSIVVVMIAIASAIVFYATRHFVRRLRAGETKVNSFMEWIKHLIEAIMGFR